MTNAPAGTRKHPPELERIPSPVRLILVALLGIAGAWALAGCTTTCESGAICGSENSISPTTIVTTTIQPTPSPSASPSAESCRIDYMILQPRDGFTLAKDEAGRVSLTPYQTVLNPDGTVAQREVSEACNLPRIPAIIWSSSSAAVTVGTGFEPAVLRVGVGVATITATLEGRVSNSVVVR